DALFLSNGLAERRVAVVAGAVELEVGYGERQPVQPEMRHLARRQRVGHRRLALRPVHIFGSDRPHRRRIQYRQKGMPASRIAMIAAAAPWSAMAMTGTRERSESRAKIGKNSRSSAIAK